ncbi:hypothetical protein [Ornithinicoccus hortensis]|uniref:Acetyltransferase (GNAT) family protein n=1 Tax=Ornithinicoccus hortensis TaxID=82346 RepID=A0A542YTB6_9MICO|nr:hypothetical protein [Ornithinicoccus hortensis]TQL51330.1 hypothetical protein FB467_2472 [Ornithinicoccus hortensis]
MVSDVRVRQLRPEEGLLAAALHVQSLRAAGRTAPPGHLDRFASAWGRQRATLPTWVAEHDGTHAGVVMVQLPAPLPADLLGPQWARVVLLYAVPSGPVERATHALLQTATRWLRSDEGVAVAAGTPGLELVEGIRVPAATLDSLGARVEEPRRVRLPAGR